jgi:hypothetical protein
MVALRLAIVKRFNTGGVRYQYRRGIMTHRKLAAVLAATLFVGNAGTALAQGTGGARVTPTPGTGTGSPSNITPTPGIGTTSNPSGTLTGGPPSGGPQGERSSSDESPSDKPLSSGAARTLANIKEETEAGVAYQPCPANVRFSNGQQMCLGLPGFPSYRPYHTPRQR